MTTPPTIRETLKAFAESHNAATLEQRDEIAELDAELSRIPTSGCERIRTIVSARLYTAEQAVEAAESRTIFHAALILGLRTGNDGECNIDKPPKWPKGPPTKAENTARGNAATDPLADPPTNTAQAEAPTTPPADATATPDELALGEARTILRDRDWADHDMNLLTPTALVEVARRNLRPEQVEINEDGGAGVAGGEVIA